MTNPCYNTSLRNAARKVTAAYDAALAPVGVGSAQFTLLRMLEAPERIALTELGNKLQLDRSTIGRNVRVLEKAGLLSIGSGLDGRETTVALSAEGRRVVKAGKPLWERAQHEFEKRLGADAARALRALLSTL